MKSMAERCSDELESKKEYLNTLSPEERKEIVRVIKDSWALASYPIFGKKKY